MAQSVIAVDLGGTKIYGTVTDEQGNILHEHRLPSQEDDGATGQLFRLIEHLLALHEGQPLGIGVGVPGITHDGSVSLAPAFGWQDYPLQAILTERFGLPVFVENDVNLAALGEYRFGAGQGADSLICIAIGTGIGSGIVLNGRLYRGHNASAGEIGYMLPGREFLGRVYDEFGALEQVASGTGIAEVARRHLWEAGNAALAQTVTTPDVIAAAQRGEAWAQGVIDETVDYLTLCIANVTAVIDPEVIVLSGGVMSDADIFIPAIQRRYEGLVPFAPRIVASSLGAKATTFGAAALVLSDADRHHP